MIKGKDFNIELGAKGVRVLLFSMRGLPGFIFVIFSNTFFNASILLVCLVGFFSNFGLQQFLILFFASVCFSTSNRISHLISNLNVLKLVDNHISKFDSCKFEMLNSGKIGKKYKINIGGNLQESFNEVSSFYKSTIKKSKQESEGSKLSGLIERLHRGGYLFAFWVHCDLGGIKSKSIDAFASRDFKFLFLPYEKYNPTPMRVFTILHEFGHVNLFSKSAYFGSEGMLRFLIVLPFLICCLDWNLYSSSILAGILILYGYLKFFYYPKKIPNACLLDEVNADRYAVWSAPTNWLEKIRSTTLELFVKGDTNINTMGRGGGAKQKSGELVEVEKYRFQLLLNEIERKRSGEKPPNMLQIIAARDSSGNIISFAANGYVEGVIGMLMAILAFKYYSLSEYSVYLGLGLSLIYISIIAFITFAVKNSYKALAVKFNEKTVAV